MEQKFLSYFQTGTKPESSNFDGTIQNLFTASFGGLTPVFVKPILADDHFKISLNSEVKVNTLSAPAYTNIKQNFYSFFVSNQSVWKHHNSFITNGTDFQDVYGSNINNQSLDGKWKVPSIPVNYLQIISKIAYGFAIPVFTLWSKDFSSTPNFHALFPDLPFNIGSSNFILSTNKVSGSFNGVTNSSIAINILQLQSPLFKSICKICPYICLSYQGDMDSVHVNSSGSSTTFSFDRIDFGCSIDDLPILFSLITNTSVDTLTTNVIENSPVDYLVTTDVQNFSFRFFADETSTDLDINNSPFGFKSSSVYTHSAGHLNLNSTRMYRKYTMNSDLSPDNVLPRYVRSTSFKTVSYNLVKLSNFFAKELFVLENSSSGTQALCLAYNQQSGDIIFIPDSSSLFADYQALYESDDFYPDYKIFNGTIYAPLYDDNAYPSFQPFTLDTYGAVANPPFPPNLQTPCTFHDFPASDFHGTTFVIYDYSCDLMIPFFCLPIHRLSTPIDEFISGHLRYVNDDTTPPNPYLYNTIKNLCVYDSSSLSTACTLFTHFLYLCRSCCKTIDYVNIPFEGFTIRRFAPYCHELVNALPFFGLSKIWDEYFRNRTVSSPELNFCDTNGICLFNSSRKQLLANYWQQFGDSSYFQTLDENSWVIPFDVLPKNGMENIVFTDSASQNKVIVSAINNFHYFTVTCFADVFALLTGFQLSNIILKQVVNSIYLTANDNTLNTWSSLIVGALIDNFQLPNYYNGLLHYKFQNFSKDYFSSSLLDAMSGANQESIPSNVSELRSAEARQSFWEQTAVARSVKKFFDKMFGTNPTHVELTRPLLLGQSHTDISVGEIIQTSESANTPQGTRTGIAGSHDISGICNHGFNEQGWLFILCSYTLESQYYQGLSKLLVPYKSFLEYPFRQFYHIGNQSINMREVNFSSNPYLTPRYNTVLPFSNFGFNFNPYSKTSISENPHRVENDPNNQTFNLVPNYCVQSDTNFDGIFGYIPRFSEYKFNFDELHGDFRSTLNSWNSFRKFHTIPYFSHNFVNWEFSGVQYDLNRLFAVQDDSDKFICSLFINVQMHRQIPYYTVPKSSAN